MQYTKEDLQNGCYFLFFGENLILRDAVHKHFPAINWNGIPTCFNFGYMPGWMGDGGEYYRANGDIEVFAHELTFLNINYELY